LLFDDLAAFSSQFVSFELVLLLIRVSFRIFQLIHSLRSQLLLTILVESTYIAAAVDLHLVKACQLIKTAKFRLKLSL